MAEVQSMIRRRTSALLIGVVLCVVGISLISYGSIVPATVVLRSRYNYLHIMGEANVFTLVGLALLPVGAGFLLFWVLTCSRKPRAPSNEASFLTDSANQKA
jgi:hypothetical protein